MSKPLKKLMKKVIASDAQEELAVSDAKLGNVIKVWDQSITLNWPAASEFLLNENFWIQSKLSHRQKIFIGIPTWSSFNKQYKAVFSYK